MKHLRTLVSKRRYPIARKFEEKGVDEFSLLNDEILILGKKCEVWWYSQHETNFFCVNFIQWPFRIYFFECEVGDLIRVVDLKKAIETGKLKEPCVKLFIEEGKDALKKPKNYYRNY